MPHVNNVIFSESKFALLFQHTTENSFWRQKQHLMIEWSIHKGYIIRIILLCLCDQILCYESLIRLCSISCQHLATSKMYWQRTKYGFETYMYHWLSMPLLLTVGQKTKKWCSKFVKQAVSFKGTKNQDDPTLWKEEISLWS